MTLEISHTPVVTPPLFMHNIMFYVDRLLPVMYFQIIAFCMMDVCADQHLIYSVSGLLMLAQFVLTTAQSLLIKTQ